MNKYIVIIALFILSGCASVSLQLNLNYEGNIALEKGRYEDAKQKFQASLNQSLSVNDAEYAAIAMYGLGRSSGYLCQFEESESWFLKSIKARESLPDKSYAYISQNIMELARLYKANRKYAKANIQFERVIPILEKLGIKESDPVGYAGGLEDYIFILEAVGNVDKAKKIASVVSKLKLDNPNRQAYFVAKQYPSNCGA